MSNSRSDFVCFASIYLSFVRWFPPGYDPVV